MNLIHSHARDPMTLKQNITFLNVENFLHQEFEYLQSAANDDTYHVVHLPIDRKSTSKALSGDQKSVTQFDRSINQQAQAHENNTYTNHQLDTALQSIKQAGNSAALMVLQFSEYQTIKKTYGSRISATLIRLAAARLRKTLATEGVFAQVAEDQYVIVYEIRDNSENVSASAERVFRHCSGIYVLRNQRINMQATVNIIQHPTETMDFTACDQYPCIKHINSNSIV